MRFKSHRHVLSYITLDLLSTPAKVWLCHIPPIHYDPTTSLWIIVYYKFSQLPHPLGKPTKWPLPLIFEPPWAHNNISNGEHWGQCLTPC